MVSLYFGAYLPYNNAGSVYVFFKVLMNVYVLLIAIYHLPYYQSIECKQTINPLTHYHIEMRRLENVYDPIDVSQI